jgi:hypothetical protein
MPTTYRVTKTINAAPTTVWALLGNGSTWTEWNPTIISFDGTIALGKKVKLVTTVNPKRAFSLKVDELDAPRRMVWSDGMPLGLFTGARTYTLAPLDGDRTEFTMEEVYTGLLAPLITRSIPDLTHSFEEFAAGLKTAAEGGA